VQESIYLKRKMKVFITGITGMIGTVFAKKYKEKGYEVYGVARSSASSRLAGVEDKSIIRCDITDRDMLDSAMEKVKPDIVIHTAAQAFNNVSWECEQLTHMTNYMGTVNVLKSSLKHASDDVKVMVCGSSTEYGYFDPKDCPLKEDHPLRPISPYGVSKAGTEQLAFQYFQNYDLKTYLPRMFIHVGTGHAPATAVHAFARQLALIAKGKMEPKLHVGRLTAERDFIDARDGVDAMMLLVEKGEAGVPVNICSGKGYKISEMLDMLIDISGLDVEVFSDPAIYRKSDEPALIGDNSRLKALGFEPKYTFRQTLEEVYADWLNRV